MKWPSYGRAPAEIMELVIADLNANYGSVHDYLVNEVRVTGDTIDRLRERLLIRLRRASKHMGQTADFVCGSGEFPLVFERVFEYDLRYGLGAHT